MRVNVLHPIFLSDQHLVAEYREVKMGPKALSRSLGSIKGIDKKKISPTYTLNTGHTYFFYDKNLFLEKRLDLLVKEMQFRGFATNHTELIDDSYDYHPNTFDEEWWNDWVPTEDAAKINLDRINERFLQKSLDPNTKGWYKFFGMSVPDMETIIKARKDGFVYTCSCNTIIDENSLNNSESICWWCCKKIDRVNLELIYLTNRFKDKGEVAEEDKNEAVKEAKKKAQFNEPEELEWKTINDYITYLEKIEIGQDVIITQLKIINKFIQINLRDSKKECDTVNEEHYNFYDDFDLENLCEVIALIIRQLQNKREIIDFLIKDFREESDLNFMKEYFSQVI